MDKKERTHRGFRSKDGTFLDEALGLPPLCHRAPVGWGGRAPNGRACNPTIDLPERRRMMQEGVDYLDRQKADGGGMPIRSTVRWIPLLYTRSELTNRDFDSLLYHIVGHYYPQT